MRAAILPLLLGLFPVLSAASSGCTGQSSAAPPSEDAGSSSSSGGGGDGGSCPTSSTSPFQYAPMGCCYAYAPPTVVTYGDLSLDSSASVSAPDATPQRVRLGLGGSVQKGSPSYADPSTMAAFTWETTGNNQAAKVRYGTSATSMTTVQTGYSWSATVLGTTAYFHEVHVCGLTPDTHYYYQVGGGASGSEVWSATQDFTTVPATGTVTMGIFGDARDVDTVWQTVHQRMKEAAVNLMLIPGDVVDLGALESDYTTWLDKIWLPDPTKPTSFLTLGQQMILPINGNHENDTAFSFSNWSIPADSQDQYPETYASLDVGSVHFVMIDDLHLAKVSTGQTDAEATTQLAWLDADLKAANADRTKHPFIVALSHRGLFSTSYHAGDSDVHNVRAQLAPLFDKYNVDLAINGHDHEYERSKPLHAGNPPSGAPVVGTTGTQYIINAGAGADPYTINMSPESYSAGVQVGFCGGGTACSQYPYIGLYSVAIATATSLTIKAYGLKPSSTSIMDDTVIDTVTLTH